MASINDEGEPLLELSTFQDFLTDGPARIEVLRADTVRVVYYCWRLVDGVWRKVVADYARICPTSSLHFPITAIPGVQIIARPQQSGGGMRLHS
jgi:hypothetical protein